MDIKLPKINFSRFNYLKYINYLTIVLVLGIFGYLGYFIYFNLYETIAEAQQVVLLKQEVAPESLDVDKIEKVLARLEKRATSTQAVNVANIKNFFTATKKQESLTVPTQATSTN